MANDGFSLYRYWLNLNKEADKNEDIRFVQESFASTIQESAAYQAGALRNGKSQPIVATREETKKCKITVIPGDEMNIGDLIYVFNEYWLCMELYTDEYGLTYGEIWMCNHIFNYQSHDLTRISKYAIIDDGSYSKGSDKAIPVTNNSFTCYVSLDDESAALYVDKRLAIDVVLDAKGEEILEVGKIVWLDTKSKNFGEGSHLLAFGLGDDVYNKERDNISLMICDYREEIEQTEEGEVTETAGYLVISGRDSIRIGTGRTYRVSTVDADGNSGEVSGEVQWSILDMPDGVSFTPSGNECTIQIQLKDDLIGVTLKIECNDLSSKYSTGNKEVAVISIG